MAVIPLKDFFSGTDVQKQKKKSGQKHKARLLMKAIKLFM